jgi:site-specific DNA-cytosine methylase
MIKILLGGSPCTKWSIAQTKNRNILLQDILESGVLPIKERAQS